MRIFTPEFSTAFVLCLAFLVGTLTGLFPFGPFVSAGDVIKDDWEAANGSPPWGRAELSALDRFCRGMEDFERLAGRLASPSVDRSSTLRPPADASPRDTAWAPAS